MRAVFLDEKTKFKKGNLLHWYEFTDPSSCMAILAYNGMNDPCLGFDFDKEIRNPAYRAQKPNPELYDIKARGVHLMNSEVN